MYNTHHQSTISALKRSVYPPKTATSIGRDRMLPPGSRLENGLGRWVNTVGHGSNERMTSDHS